MKIKDVFIFLFGAAVGAGGMYLALDKKTRSKIEEAEKKINEELDKLANKAEDICIENPESTIKPIDIPDEEAIKKQYEQVIERVDYTKAVASEKVTSMTDAVKDDVKEMISEAKKTTKKAKVPRKVTQEEFDATSDDKRKILYFYADGVLADDEDVTYDPTETMGATNLKNFKSTYDTVYIFNYARDFMFEIRYSNSKYSDIVGGDLRR